MENSHKLTAWQKFYRGFKATADFFIALISLILLSPLFIIVAIAIKVDSKGPVFFSHKRIGKNGKLFNCIKFRSMAQNARHDVAGYEYAEASAYITKVGAFLRKYSIDELPQLFNMLTFKMSLIGYRPSQENEKELNDAREGYDMYQIRPGISGWAQVNGRDILAANPTKKAEFDNYYLEHFSFFLDVKIFFMTIKKVFKGDDVEEGIVCAENARAGENSNENTRAGENSAESIRAGENSNETGETETNKSATAEAVKEAKKRDFDDEKKDAV